MMTMMIINLKRILLTTAFLYVIFLVRLLIHIDGYFYLQLLEDTTNIKERPAVRFLVSTRIGTTPKLTVGHAIAIPLRISGRFNTTSVVVDNEITPPQEQKFNVTIDHQNYANGTVLIDHINRSKYLSQNCLNSHTDILIFVLSEYSRVGQRETIRQTWAKELTSNGSMNTYITILFIIGKRIPTFISHDVEAELQEHRDILIGDFKDDNKHTGPSKSDILKTLLGVNWLVEHHCYHSNLVVLTAFDDFYVNLTLLHQKLQPIVLKTTILDKFWIGNVRKGLKPNRKRNSPWYMSVKDYHALELPTFCTMESGFVFSFGAAKDLLERFRAKNYRVLPLLDIFVGIIARDGNWNIFQDQSVIQEWSQSSDICAARHQTITVGLSSPQRLTDIFSNDSTSRKRIQRLCRDPELDAVLQANVSNTELFNAVLRLSTNPRDACRIHVHNVHGKSKQSVFLVMLISSKPEHFARRSAIRETYGKEKIIQNKHVQLLFVLGLSHSKSVNNAAQHEANTYKDMIIFGFYESHFNLTLKVIGGLKWVTENCQEAKFMYKGDDDVFVNIDLMVAHLDFADNNKLAFFEKRFERQGPKSNNSLDTTANINETTCIKSFRRDAFMKEKSINKTSMIRRTYVNGTIIQKVYINQTFRIPKERLYLGSINLGPVIRDKQSKYYVSEKDYKGTFFPPFLSGGSYIISGDVIPALFNASVSVPIINNDDVYQGILAKKIEMRPIHYDGFRNLHTKTSRWRTHVDICQLRENIWTLHGFSDKNLKILWNMLLTSPDRPCFFSFTWSWWLIQHQILFICVVVVTLYFSCMVYKAL
ncbi:uncharacterized protein [Amphiura filiformis]|uniref:uncharacterized protein n=1 Tax=Amphiura filiformis TaxID=82378 RepID=UPI003B21C499